MMESYNTNFKSEDEIGLLPLNKSNNQSSLLSSCLYITSMLLITIVVIILIIFIVISIFFKI